MNQDVPGELNRDEFEKFLIAFTHEIRNRLNGIGLEAADLAEQAGAGGDAARLQGRIQDCSAFLKEVRDTLAPDSPQKGRVSPAELVKRWRDRKAAGAS